MNKESYEAGVNFFVWSQALFLILLTGVCMWYWPLWTAVIGTVVLYAGHVWWQRRWDKQQGKESSSKEAQP